MKGAILFIAFIAVTVFTVSQSLPNRSPNLNYVKDLWNDTTFEEWANYVCESKNCFPLVNKCPFEYVCTAYCHSHDFKWGLCGDNTCDCS